ncbi:uncharacterized membrane protein YcaP (DUF421 family) [Clostridium tetanomorphum]|uniref:DUF421 domain-containing protein n=1 Tax=Clostridium tetanomorphum TaxID=1553 RepID=A0A923EDT4_CLOTT|nr:YetF domain-containing protein [Clostridium tetanomorphum]KAJ49807.1 hypothetical protein CTM_21086 [Clostridium tetanomorphum DSM 665]MBC2399706.1 DUF421 domain-containing protein [Clostridium tetanomorphum]MBP1865108.1 uncharacterized membrane protein YcaP (DUF421 family) [Clostridium tetanomorphum]NRS84753.1 uncharacterized membrane protein YcaP (DUF421 family) [Clostridium tetanomorphum]NRZ97969.1 uncharacterized membrane protein YcaP (DUF421 family) [Clostridium tetanomorphum]
MIDFLTFTIRVILVFYFTYLCTRGLTKKAMAQMTAYEVAGLMILANVAAEPLVDKVTIKSVYGAGLLVILMIISTRLAFKNALTPILEHTPTVIINKGNLNMKALKSTGLSLNQLEGLIRQQGYDKISDLDTVIMEPQGNISVFPKSENRPVTLKDLNIKTYEQGITIPLIMDGDILYTNLKHIKRTKDWLLQELNKQGILDYKKEVGIAELDTSWQLSVLKK